LTHEFRFIGAGADEKAAGPANWQGPVWLVLNYCLLYFHPDSGDGMGASNFMCWNLTVFAMPRRLEEGQSLESL